MAAWISAAVSAANGCGSESPVVHAACAPWLAAASWTGKPFCGTSKTSAATTPAPALPMFAVGSPWLAAASRAGKPFCGALKTADATTPAPTLPMFAVGSPCHCGNQARGQVRGQSRTAGSGKSACGNRIAPRRERRHAANWPSGGSRKKSSGRLPGRRANPHRTTSRPIAEKPSPAKGHRGWRWDWCARPRFVCRPARSMERPGEGRHKLRPRPRGSPTGPDRLRQAHRREQAARFQGFHAEPGR